MFNWNGITFRLNSIIYTDYYDFFLLPNNLDLMNLIK